MSPLLTLRTTPVPTHLESPFATILDPRDTLDSPASSGILRKDGSDTPSLAGLKWRFWSESEKRRNSTRKSGKEHFRTLLSLLSTYRRTDVVFWSELHIYSWNIPSGTPYQTGLNRSFLVIPATLRIHPVLSRLGTPESRQVQNRAQSGI